MSCANMGISQLECLQLRRLVGPAGVGAVSTSLIGNPTSTTTILDIPMFRLPDGSALGQLTTSLTVPSGTGVMMVTVECNILGGNILYYTVGTSGALYMRNAPVNINLPQEGFSGWYYQGLTMYNNPTSVPAPIILQVGSTAGAPGTTVSVGLISMDVKYISYGPYVSQN